ncbi:GDSL-type esterase/lipase family protein [Lutibacter sp. A80]|uniref:GDSL-type esterase/lipase family protein n=1 Tax=Lutibacter sp. A80 TaxID=2918453 RepID=UPI001F056460|nr:GDSL-type esterase/lipase family protein [Lutibacter sp. A80]UMB60903.1 GDSL-type esterase/lipase family protein [Lutibacter sp. A80]
MQIPSKFNSFRSQIKLLFIVIFSISIVSCQQQKEFLITLEGKIVDSNNVNKIQTSYLQINRAEDAKGLVMFIPGAKINNDSIFKVYNQMGFSVATLKGQHLKLEDVITAFHFIKSDLKFNLNTDYTCIVGNYEGAKSAALAVYKLDEEARPNALTLINPVGFDEVTEGTVFPAINPPLVTKTKLLCIANSLKLNNKEYTAASEFTKTWIGYDGVAFFKDIATTENLTLSNKNVVDILKAFNNGKMTLSKEKENPAAISVEGYSPKRHAEKIKLIKAKKYDLLFVGNSITNNFEKPAYQAIWKKYFGSRNAINLGYSGYRTENIIWNIQNGELENQSPKVIILEIGTNNIDEKNYPTRHTASQLAVGIEKIIKIFREKCPESKIILLRSFPGCYGGPNPTSHRRILERASDITSKLADNKHIFYCDVNHVFLNIDGSLKNELMPDWLHPNAKGAELWAQTMEPLLSRLMEDESKDDKKPLNTAIIPVSKLEEDSYNWWERHNDVLKLKDSLNPEIVLIGNSITHFWGGNFPPFKNADGTSRKANGLNSWKKTFGNYKVLNLGFGWDRTQNVLWRLDNGELDRLDPKLVIIHIGTNNTSNTKNARINTASEIVEGIKAICLRVRSKTPRAKIVLTQIMPREEMPNNSRRILINETNQILEKFADKNNISLIDISSKMLTEKGVLTKKVTLDFCHPNDIGYQIWGNALQTFIDTI